MGDNYTGKGLQQYVSDRQENRKPQVTDSAASIASSGSGYGYLTGIVKDCVSEPEEYVNREVEIGGKKVKSARAIKPGETIVVRKGAVFYSYKVINIPKSRVGAALVQDYAVDVTPKEQLDKLEMIRLANIDRPKGLGRPTKRDRRNWAKTLGDD